MSWLRYLSRSLVYYWRTNLAVIVGVAIAVSVLSGALLVGGSVRQSLRELIYQRLGATDYLISSEQFFHENLADRLGGLGESCPVILLRGVVTAESSGTQAHDVNVYGIDRRFWVFQGMAGQKSPEGRAAVLGSALAGRIGIHEGDTLLLRVEAQEGIPKESLFGRRENAGRTLRLSCDEVLAADRLGEFALRPSQGEVLSIFVPLQRLQWDLAQPGRANAILLKVPAQGRDLQSVRKSLENALTVTDAGLVLRPLPQHHAVSVESSRVLLDDFAAGAAFEAAAANGMKASGIFTYLANSIRAANRSIPYSVISAVALDNGAFQSVRTEGGGSIRSRQPDGGAPLWLNEWAWHDLGCSPGEVAEVDYYYWQEDGRLVTRTALFRLAGAVAIGGDIDASLAPDFPGITEARSISSWDPPFPLDLRLIRPKDEEYWNRYNATPKAFIMLQDGQKLWQNRFGKFTAVRAAIPPGVGIESGLKTIEAGILHRLRPETSGFSVSDLREAGLEASRGSTDFGEYFVYFSFFLIAAAVLLAALFFRLGVEQRVLEVGTLLAMGVSRKTVRRLFLLEGAILSAAGSIAGVIGAAGYGAFMVLGLRTWWSGAAGTGRLFLHVSPSDLGIGAGAGILASLGAVVWTLRALGPASPRLLLAGVPEVVDRQSRRSRIHGSVSIAASLAAVLLLAGSTLGKIAEVEGFVGAGFFLLVSTLSLAALYLRRRHPVPITGHGWRAFLRLGIRNVACRPGRSLLCITLIAGASFIIVSLEAFRADDRAVSMKADSGIGGYPLIAESSLAVTLDPNSEDGREALGIPASEFPQLAQVHFVPFRYRSGDDASCLNLYAPLEPRILGAPHSFVEAGRFSFQDSIASGSGREENPWRLLESAPVDGAIPAIGDANTIRYILHLSLGSVVTVRGDDGGQVRLRLVAELRDSILQGELLISEANFLRVFPQREGFRFFLLEAPPAAAEALIHPLITNLADWGFNVESSRARLAAYHRVENTYLSTFQSLGVLGLLLGTAGLAAVLLRNVLERRRELALMRAVGYRRTALSAIIVAENAALMVTGLVSGTICSVIAIMPALHARGNSFPAAMVGLILLGVLVVGLTSSVLAVIAALRSPLIPSLRSE